MIMAIPVIEPRIRAFEELGFGMFIHWGLYSQMEKGEWVMNMEHIAKDEYVKLKDTFTASKFDAEKIAKLAKDSGMNYITLTTRHHDGFSLYDTCGLNEYDAPHSPAKRDLIKEFVDACNKYDIVPFLYHTTLDWHNEDFDNDFPTYLKYLNRSVEILCTNYGKIGGLWFDGNWSKPDEDWKESELYATIRKHQPDAIIVNNTGLSERGRTGHIELDSVTFEQGRPTPIDREGAPKYLAAEMCNTLNAHWGVGGNDFKYQSVSDLIETLCSCRRVGANYLLNIGPDALGEVLPLQRELLLMVGQWVSLFADAVYKPIPSKVQGYGKDFVLEDDKNYYFFIHNLDIVGDENVTVAQGGSGVRGFSQMKEELQELYWMDNKQHLDFAGNPQNGLFTFFAPGFPYGMNTVVRVAVGVKK